MEHNAGILILLFVSLALLTGAATRHLLKGTPIPYTVALLLLGLGLGLMQRGDLLHESLPMVHESIQLISRIDPHLILFLFLPTLIFESAFAMEVHLFRRTFSQIAILAVPGMLLCSLLTALFVHAVFPWQWSWTIALMFGALISATDPVAVVALLKEQSSRKRLETLIEGESLLNDGTAIVLFALFYGMVVAGDQASFSIVETAGQFAWVVSMGLLIGAVLAGFALVWVGRVFNDAMIEITVTVAAAYLVFFVAEELLHVSGVVGIVVLALLFASVGRTRISPEVAGFLHHFWELMAYMANTLIFLLVGIVIADRVRVQGVEPWVMLALLYGCLFMVRGGMVALFSPLLKRIGIGITREKGLVLVWGGLRGAVALALALVVVQDPRVPEQVGDMVLFLCAGIVVLTILVNGSTMPMLFRWLGLDRLPPAKQATIDKARVAIDEELGKLMPVLQQNQFLQAADWVQIRAGVSAEPGADSAQAAIADSDLDTAYRRRLLESERKHYWTQYQQGMLSAAAVGRLVAAVEHALDVQPRIGPRPEVQRLWALPRVLNLAERLPFLRGLALSISYDRMATGYDAARGFIQAQDAILEYVGRLAPDEDAARRVRDEIHDNKRETFLRIEQLRGSFPEILAMLETQAATRMLLNRERAVIRQLAADGVLDVPEVERMVDAVEDRMHALKRVPCKRVASDPLSALRSTPALTGVDEQHLCRLADAASVKLYASGDWLVHAGQMGAGLMLILRGAVELIEENGEQVCAVLGAGTWLGAGNLSDGKEHAAVRAATPVESLWLSAASLEKTLGNVPESLHQLMVSIE